MGKKSKLYLHNLQTRDMKNAGNCKREAFKNSGSLPHPLFKCQVARIASGSSLKTKRKSFDSISNILEFWNLEKLKFYIGQSGFALSEKFQLI